MEPTLPPGGAKPPSGHLVLRTSLAQLVSALYAQASPMTRLKLLARLLQPVGPLALVAIAAGAFASLLPTTTRWQGARVSPDDAQRLGPDQILELARYVEQKCPELLLQLPQQVADPRLWFGTASGLLLWLVLQRMRRPR